MSVKKNWKTFTAYRRFRNRFKVRFWSLSKIIQHGRTHLNEKNFKISAQKPKQIYKNEKRKNSNY